jgi:hypothetical protein
MMTPAKEVEQWIFTVVNVAVTASFTAATAAATANKLRASQEQAKRLIELLSSRIYDTRADPGGPVSQGPADHRGRLGRPTWHARTRCRFPD